MTPGTSPSGSRDEPGRGGEDLVQPALPEATRRLDWVLALLAAILVGGFYVDLWAHSHGEVDNTFLTPWHALLYSGAASFGIVLGIVGWRALRRGVPIRRALPPAYRTSFLGSVFFVVAGVFDLIWHTLFGFEVSTESLLSPAHLALLASGLMMVSGPIVSVRSRSAVLPGTWRDRGPLVVGLTAAFAMLSAFTGYAHPILDPWPEALPSAEIRPIPAQLHGMAADGSDQHRLWVSTESDWSPALSPDGRSLAFARLIDDQTQIFVRDVASGEERQLTNADSNGRPRWSPDGTRLLFESDRSGSWEVHVMSADGTAPTQLTDSTGESWAAAWSPDGTAIAFNSNRDGGFEIYRAAADGSGPTRLTTNGIDDFEPSWSPDGRFIAFNALADTHVDGKHAGYVIAVMPADGSGPPRWLTEEGDSYSATWSPDGSRIAYVTNRGTDYEVYSMAADGSDERNLTQSPGTDEGWLGLSWSPDGMIRYASVAPVPWWRVDTVRQGLGAASYVIYAMLVAAFVLFLLRSGPIPLGALTMLIAVPVVLTAFTSDEPRFIPAAIVAGLVADLVVRLVGYGRTRWRTLLVAFVLPALPAAAFFGTLAFTTGIGWTIHLWLGAIVLSGGIGLLLELLLGPAAPQGSDRTGPDPLIAGGAA